MEFHRICVSFAILIQLGFGFALASNDEMFATRNDECNTDELCAIANCDAPDAPKLCPRECTDPKCYADFGFIVDVSGSLTSHWDRERDFLKQLAQAIWISPAGGRAAVVQFSSHAELMINFSNHTSLSGFETALDGLHHWDGTTRIDEGLDVALNEMFQESNGMRPDVSHNLVLITDGHQTGGNVDYDEFRRRLNEKKIRVLVILVGNSNRKDIRHLVNRDSDLYVASSYDDLISDAFVSNVVLCGEFSALVDCRDKSSYCARYGKRYCRYPFFTSGSYSCLKTCELC